MIKLNISFEYDPHTVVELVWLESLQGDLFVNICRRGSRPKTRVYTRTIKEQIMHRWATDKIDTPIPQFSGRWAEVATWMLEIGKGYKDEPNAIAIEGLKGAASFLNIREARQDEPKILPYVY
jgi:hypothetical protein